MSAAAWGAGLPCSFGAYGFKCRMIRVAEDCRQRPRSSVHDPAPSLRRHEMAAWCARLTGNADCVAASGSWRLLMLPARTSALRTVQTKSRQTATGPAPAEQIPAPRVTRVCRVGSMAFAAVPDGPFSEETCRVDPRAKEDICAVMPWRRRGRRFRWRAQSCRSCRAAATISWCWPRGG